MSPSVNLIISFGIAFFVAGAGLIMKSDDLILLGIVIIGIGVAVHFYRRKPTTEPHSALMTVSDERSLQVGPDQPELSSLRRAVTDAKKAARRFSRINRDASFSRLSAAFAIVSKNHGIPGFEFEATTQRGLLMLLIDYVDCFLPLLEDGQPAAARYAARCFLED